MSGSKDIEKLETDLLLSGIYQRYGYDFSHYSPSSLMRRLQRAKQDAGAARFTELLDILFHDETAFDSFLRHMSITVTEMFRDPLFYRDLREKVVPAFKTYPFVKIWLAGCATGEEAYSMAILLHEEGFLDRVRIYATDFNKHSLDIAQTGVYPSRCLGTYEENYRAAGGKTDFSHYYSAGYELVKFKDFLKKRIIFSYHNLVTDGVFGEMNLILCRNVLIYFDRTLQNRALTLFDDSLRHGGFLCLGAKESLNFTAVKKQFSATCGKQKIYRKSGETYAVAS